MKEEKLSTHKTRRGFVMGLLVATALIIAGLVVVLQPSLPFVPDSQVTNSTAAANLARFHEGLLERYPRAEHITTAALSDLSADQVLLFDVREMDEFDVSHLENAIQIDPNISADLFLTLYGNELQGKTLIFYCSVGERSSRLAQAVSDATEGLTIANLEGGIFKWHNEFRPVYNATAQTDAVHPFNSFWGRLLER